MNFIRVAIGSICSEVIKDQNRRQNDIFEIIMTRRYIYIITRVYIVSLTIYALQV